MKLRILWLWNNRIVLKRSSCSITIILIINTQTFKSITYDIVSFKIYNKRDYLNFKIENFSFLDVDVPCSPSYNVYILQCICLQEYVLM